MKRNKQNKDNYLVATDAPIFPGGDAEPKFFSDFTDDFSDVDLDDDLAGFAEADDRFADDGASLVGDSIELDDDDEPAMTGKKAAFFSQVESHGKHASAAPQAGMPLDDDDDYDEFGEIEIDEDIFMEGNLVGSSSLQSEAPKKSSGISLINDDAFGDDFVEIDLDDAEESAFAVPLSSPVAELPKLEEESEEEGEPEVMTGRKAALFHSVEPAGKEASRFVARADKAPKQPVVEKKPAAKAAAPKPPSLSPLKPLESKAAAQTSTNKVAAEYGGDASVFGSVGGHVSGSKKRGEIIRSMKYLNHESIAGIDLWEDGATACFLKWNRGKLQITHAGHIEFPEGIGDVEKATMLKGFWKNLKMPTRSVWVNVHNPSLLQKYVRYDMPVDELESTLRRDAEESMPGAVGNVVMDWNIKERFGGGGEGLLFALPIWEQEHLLSILRRAGLLVCGMSVAACDIARLVAIARTRGSGAGSAECVCSMSRTGADIVIIYGDGAVYSRTVYSRAGGWEKNLSYLFECMNDAVNYFNSWISRDPVATILLCGQVPEVEDLGGAMLRETGLLAEVWNPVADSDIFELTGAAKRSGVLGRNLVGSLGVAMERG